MGDPVSLGVALFATSTASTLYATRQEKKAADAQSAANERREKLEQRRANVQAARERAKVLRQQRIARAQTTASGSAGAGTSPTAISGVRGNIQGQGFGNLQFLNQNQSLSNQISALNISTGRQIAKFQTRANFGSAVSSISGAGASLFGGKRPSIDIFA